MSGIGDALDALGGRPGTAQAEGPGGPVEIEVMDVDRLGVRVRRVAVGHALVDVVAEAEALPRRLRALSGAVVPVEIAPELGGARLRSAPGGMGGGWFEVSVEPAETVITRTVKRDGERAPDDWTMTREQLEQLVQELDGCTNS